MHLGAEDVLRLARQARFALSPEELELFRTQLNAVLEQIALLEELPDGEERVAAEPVGAPMRSDDSPPDPLALPLDALSADLVARFFTVPRIIGGTRTS